MGKSIGIFETRGYSAALAAAEGILEVNGLKVLAIKQTGGGIVSLFCTGGMEQLKTGFKKAVQNSRLVGEIVATHLISQPKSEIENLIIKEISEKKVLSVIEKYYYKPALAHEKETGKSNITATKSNGILKKTSEETESRSVNSAALTSTIQRLRSEAFASSESQKEKVGKLKPKSEKKFTDLNIAKIQNLNVHQIRRLARNTDKFPIQGREISRANRKELLDYFKDII